MFGGGASKSDSLRSSVEGDLSVHRKGSPGLRAPLALQPRAVFTNLTHYPELSVEEIKIASVCERSCPQHLPGTEVAAVQRGSLKMKA